MIIHFDLRVCLQSQLFNFVIFVFPFVFKITLFLIYVVIYNSILNLINLETSMTVPFASSLMIVRLKQTFKSLFIVTTSVANRLF